MPVEFCVTTKNKIQVKDATACNARAAVASLAPGVNVYGFTLGQFSISDLIAEVLEITGPADMDVSTWTASGAKIDEAFALFESGKIRRARFLLDPGFKNRQPKFADLLIRRFGADAVRTVANHAKFVVLRNDDWNVTIRTSMNLNNNPRLENYEINESAELADHMSAFMDYIFAVSSADENWSRRDEGGLHAKCRQVTEEDLLAALG